MKHYRTCNLCEAMCGLVIEHEGHEILSIKGDPNDPLSRGHICPKAVALKDIYKDPDRLKKPQRKTATGWQEIEWDEAFDEVVNRLRVVQEHHGVNSLGVYQGNPNVHNFGTMIFGPNFVRSLRTKSRFSATSADQLPHHVASLLMFGHYFMIPIPDIDRTDFMLIIGANPLVSNGSMMTCPDYGKRLKAVQARGGKVVVVDPRRTETAHQADEHLFIKPGRDALLLLAMIHVVVEEGLVDLGNVEGIVEGVEEVKQIVEDFSPEHMSPVLGIDAEAIRRLAMDFAQAKSAVCYSRMGASTQIFGGLCLWLTHVLNILTGNMDRPGGAMFTQPAFDFIGTDGKNGRTGTFGSRKTRVRGLPNFTGEFPVAAMTEEIATEGDGQLKAMVTIAGNPVLSTPNGQALDKALEQLEFMVAIDIYLNETTRHADIILPPATGLEVSHYDVIFNTLAVRNVAKYSPPLFEKSADQRYDWEIFQELTARLTGKPNYAIPPELALKKGLEGSDYEGMSLEKLIKEPHGVDLGPLSPALPGRLFTPNKRIQLAPEAFLQDLDRLRKFQVQIQPQTQNSSPHSHTQPHTFLLIGRRQLRSNNSWMHNSHRLVKGKNRCTLMIHPDDAQAAGLETGEIAIVSSPQGAVRLPVEITQDMMPGVVSIPHGWGHRHKDIQLAVAQSTPGVSVNDLTDNALIDELTGNAAFNGVPVEVRKDGFN